MQSITDMSRTTAVFQCWIFRLIGTKTVVIAFRGTQTDRIYDTCVDAIRDIDCWQRPYDFDPSDPCILDLNPVIDTLQLRVHRGFFTGYLSIRDTVLETVFHMTKGWNSEWSVVVTGHSLGASIAILCGTELANRYAFTALTMHLIFVCFTKDFEK